MAGDIRPPLRLGSFEVTGYDELIPDRVWRCRGDGFVARVELLTTARACAAMPAIERRVRKLRRMLRRADRDVHVLLPLECGVEPEDSATDHQFVWMTAESPGPDATPWTSTYLALDSLANALRFLHARRLLHGGVAAENLWLHSDGLSLLAPWCEFGHHPGPARSPRILGHAVEMAADVDAFVALLPHDGSYRELLERTAGQRAPRPTTGLALLNLLRSTPAGRAYVASFDEERRREHLDQLAGEWLATPPFLASPAWCELERRLEAELSIEIGGGWGCGKTRWLMEIAERERVRGAVIAGGRGVTRAGVVLEALEDLIGQGHPVDEELAAARGALLWHELLDALVCATERIAPAHRLVWLLSAGEIWRGFLVTFFPGVQFGDGVWWSDWARDSRVGAAVHVMDSESSWSIGVWRPAG